jgi:hypothetical protein
MAFISKLLGAGPTNAGTGTVLYTVPTTSSGAIVRNVRLVTVGNAGTASVYFRPSGGSQVQISENKSLSTAELMLISPELTLAVGDSIEATTGVAMDFVVCGMERTL